MAARRLSMRSVEARTKAGWRTPIFCRDSRSCARRLLLRLGLLVAIACVALSPAARAAGTVSVLYAGSLVNLMEREPRAGLRQGERRSVSGLCRRLEFAGQPDQGQAAAGRCVHQRGAQGQRQPDGAGEWRLGQLVCLVRTIATGDRLQPGEPLRRGLQVQALVSGADGAGDQDRADRPQARPEGRA